MSEQQQLSNAADLFNELRTTFKSIVMTPQVFFENLAVPGELKDALIFFTAIALVNAVGQGIFTLNLLKAGLLFVYMMVFSGIWCGYIYFWAKMLGGTGSFMDTYRGLSYASAPNVVAWLPFINFFSALYALYLSKMALERVHGLPTNRAVAVVLIGLGTVIVLGVIAAFVGLSALLKAQSVN